MGSGGSYAAERECLLCENVGGPGMETTFKLGLFNICTT